MRDFPVFTTEYGVASLIFKEIPYRQEAYIRIRDVQPGKLPELLAELVEKKGIKKSYAIKAAEMSEVYGYQIFSGIRHPERNKLLCLAIGMNLTLDETQNLLKCAGYNPLYVKLPFDSVVIYGICKRLSVIKINEILFGNNLETLG